MPIFTNTLGLFALLGIPLVVLIHCLQQKRKKLTISTMFLLDALAPESITGKNWERLRQSLAFWMQILIILILTWILSEPRFLQKSSGQTVVYVLDDSLNMAPFKGDAIHMIQTDIDTYTSSQIPTTWVMMTSSQRRATLYSGTDLKKAMSALESWTPTSGEHDPNPSIRTARALVKKAGYIRFVSCKENRVPAGISALGVGRELNNVGFIGIMAKDKPEDGRWRIMLRNYAKIAQSREITYQIGNQKKTEAITLGANAVQELDVMIPAGVDKLLLRLNTDEFPSDDVIPIVRHIPRPLSVSFSVSSQTDSILRRMLMDIPGVKLTRDGQAQLSIVETSVLPKPMTGMAIYLDANAIENPKLFNGITAEKHDLTKDLEWGALITTEPGKLQPTGFTYPLLWMQDKPLAWLEKGSLILNWNWKYGNSTRIPPALFLIRRYVTNIQANSSSFMADNYPCSTPLPVVGAKSITFTSESGVESTTEFHGNAPASTGFFEVFSSEKPSTKTRMMFGATYFPDARQGDFADCNSFDLLPPHFKESIQHITAPDPLIPLWLALGVGAFLLSWIPPRSERTPRT